MKIILFAFSILVGQMLNAQELQAKLTVMSARVSNQVDKKVFQTLQTGLTNFLNTRKWTSDTYQPQEKIKCNFLLNIEQELGSNTYKASLTIQAARPVYNSTYESPIINYQDNDVVFKYVEFQPIEFNDNRVQGNDPLVANLTAVLAYYVNIILGMDYDSFSPRGGDPFFQKAQNIVSNSPESQAIVGWKAFDGLRNRFKLVEGLVDSRYTLVHDAIYAYYRTGMDQFSSNEELARTGVYNALNYLNSVNQQNPNSMILQFFFQGKGNELLKVFSKGDQQLKAQARDLLVKLDLTNANLYKDLK
ncbi:MAG TPA: DUF4835 family protein [Flavisolibacter sp.]|nr:DUF4835 family protein [Flavisolibacter sp.]